MESGQGLGWISASFRAWNKAAGHGQQLRLTKNAFSHRIIASQSKMHFNVLKAANRSIRSLKMFCFRFYRSRLHSGRFYSTGIHSSEKLDPMSHPNGSSTRWSLQYSRRVHRRLPRKFSRSPEYRATVNTQTFKFYLSRNHFPYGDTFSRRLSFSSWPASFFVGIL